MKKLLTLLTAALSVTAYGQTYRSSMAVIDISSFLKENSIGISFCHGISQKWSAEAYALARIPRFGKVSDEDIRHEEEFEGTKDIPTYGDVTHCIGIRMNYWPEGVFRKTCIGAGIRTIRGTKSEITASIGHVLDIWKGLAATLSIEVDLLRSWKEERMLGRGIGLGLCYKF